MKKGENKKVCMECSVYNDQKYLHHEILKYCFHFLCSYILEWFRVL